MQAPALCAEWLGEMSLLMGSIMFGVSVVLSKNAMLYTGPYTFSAIVHVLGMLVLIVFQRPLRRLAALVVPEEANGAEHNMLVDRCQDLLIGVRADRQVVRLALLGGLYGLTQFGASVMTQIGLVYLDAGKSAFLTSMYIIFTPLLQHLLVDASVSKLNTWTWISAVTGLLGSLLISVCSADGCRLTFGSFGFGEAVTLSGAVVWSVQIIISDIGSKCVDSIDLAVVGITVSAALCTIAALIVEPNHVLSLIDSPSSGSILAVWTIVLAVSVLDAGADVFDMVGQSATTGYRAAIIMGLDSVVAVVVAFLWLDERMSCLESLGCCLLLFATYLSSMSDVEANHDNEKESISVLSVGHTRRVVKRWRIERSSGQRAHEQRPRYFSYGDYDYGTLTDQDLLDEPFSAVRGGCILSVKTAPRSIMDTV